MAFATSHEANENVILNQDAYNVSDRYQQISTQEVLDEMNNYSNDPFKITGYHQANVRKHEKENKQKHLVMLQRSDSLMLDGTHMNIVLYNSSDRSSTLKLYLGSYREACSNGIIWGDDLAEPLSIRHTGSADKWKHSIKDLMDEYADLQKQTNEMINRMMNKYMSYGDIGRFANQAINEILNPVIEGEIIDPLQAVTAKRPEDVGKDLYRTYNKLQEYMLQGGLQRIIRKNDQDEPSRLIDVVSNTHKITDTQKQIKINQELHSMALDWL